jgi:DNA-binding NtrC family response regulator
MNIAKYKVSWDRSVDQDIANQKAVAEGDSSAFANFGRCSMNAIRPVDEFTDIVLEAFLFEPKPQIKMFMEEMEKRLILAILDRVGGNQKEAARILGIKYTTFNEKVKRHNILFRKQAVHEDSVQTGVPG